MGQQSLEHTASCCSELFYSEIMFPQESGGESLNCKEGRWQTEKGAGIVSLLSVCLHTERGVHHVVNYVIPAPKGVRVMVQGNHGHCATAGPASSHVHFPTEASYAGG